MVAVMTNPNHLIKLRHHANTWMAIAGHAYCIPTDGETQLILPIDPKTYLVPWLFKVGNNYSFALTPCFLQGHKFSTNTLLNFQDNSIILQILNLKSRFIIG